MIAEYLQEKEKRKKVRKKEKREGKGKGKKEKRMSLQAGHGIFSDHTYHLLSIKIYLFNIYFWTPVSTVLDSLVICNVCPQGFDT